jgi:membrane protease YdiL (CAAX protease family)
MTQVSPAKRNKAFTDHRSYLEIPWAVALFALCVLLQVCSFLLFRELAGKNLAVIASLILGLLAPAVIVILWVSPHPMRTLRLKGISPLATGWIIGASLCFALSTISSVELILRTGIVPTKILLLLEEEEALLRDLFSFEGLGNLLAVWGIVVMIAPVAEELLFRGLLQGSLERRLGNWSGLLIAGLTFGLLHGQLRFIPVGLLGIMMGYMVMRTNSVLAGMLAHGCNNSVAMALAFAAETEPLPLWSLISAIIIGILGLVFSLRAFRHATDHYERIEKITPHPAWNGGLSPIGGQDILQNDPSD